MYKSIIVWCQDNQCASPVRISNLVCCHRIYQAHGLSHTWINLTKQNLWPPGTFPAFVDFFAQAMSALLCLQAQNVLTSEKTFSHLQRWRVQYDPYCGRLNDQQWKRKLCCVSWHSSMNSGKPGSVFPRILWKSQTTTLLLLVLTTATSVWFRMGVTTFHHQSSLKTFSTTGPSPTDVFTRKGGVDVIESSVSDLHDKNTRRRYWWPARRQLCMMKRTELTV